MAQSAALHPVNPYGAVNPPVVRSSTFTFPTAAEGAARFAGEPGLLYSRLANPTVTALEDELARLEGAGTPGLEDVGAVAAASGMGAIHVTLMSLLRPGARLVVDPCVYGCTYALLHRLADWGVDLVTVDSSDPAALAAAVAPGVDVVFLETPMNPNLRIVDIEAAARMTHAAGGLLVVDNTFATPIAQQPLKLGADIVVHSLTKAIGGHSDLIAGAAIARSELLDPIRGWVKDAGPVLDPDAAYLALRGARTLELRVKAMTANAHHVAQELAADGLAVRHPLLPDHPDHAVAARQMPLGCSILTVDLGSAEAAMAFLDRLQLVQRAVSLGGFESLASHPASTTHALMGPDGQAAAAIGPGIVRIHTGLEPVEALLEDIRQAIERSVAVVA